MRAARSCRQRLEMAATYACVSLEEGFAAVAKLMRQDYRRRQQYVMRTCFGSILLQRMFLWALDML